LACSLADAASSEPASARRLRDDEFEVGDPVRQTERQAGRADVLMAMSVVQMPMLPRPCITCHLNVGGVVPQRTATSNSCSRAKRTAAMTSPPFPQNSMSVGRRSIRPFQTFRALSEPALDGATSLPLVALPSRRPQNCVRWRRQLQHGSRCRMNTRRFVGQSGALIWRKYARHGERSVCLIVEERIRPTKSAQPPAQKL